MSLLDELFPGFCNLDCDVPYFPDKSAPWSILSTDDNGLVSQLMSIQEQMMEYLFTRMLKLESL